MNRKTKRYILLCVLCLIVSIIAFHMSKPENILSKKIGLFFIIYSEILCFGTLIYGQVSKKTKRKISILNLTRCLEIYSSVSFGTALCYTFLVSNHVSEFIILQICFACACSLTLCLSSLSEGNTENKKTINTDSLTKSLINELEIIYEMTDKKSDIQSLIHDINMINGAVIINISLKLYEEIQNLATIVKSSEFDETKFYSTIQNIENIIKNK